MSTHVCQRVRSSPVVPTHKPLYLKGFRRQHVFQNLLRFSIASAATPASSETNQCPSRSALPTRAAPSVLAIANWRGRLLKRALLLLKFSTVQMQSAADNR